MIPLGILASSASHASAALLAPTDLVAILVEPEEPALEGFFIKTVDGTVAEIVGSGEVVGTGVFVAGYDGQINGYAKLEEVLSWPAEKPEWLNPNGVTFWNSTALIKVPDYLPAWMTNASGMFSGCTSFNQDISGWDTSNITNMSSMFSGCSSFNQDISGWDTSNVTNMSGMFMNCTSFNQDLSGWCVSNIPSMPSNFSAGANAWTLPKPVWGTCPA